MDCVTRLDLLSFAASRLAGSEDPALHESEDPRRTGIVGPAVEMIASMRHASFDGYGALARARDDRGGTARARRFILTHHR
jgi:hypothetical protein